MNGTRMKRSVLVGVLAGLAATVALGSILARADARARADASAVRTVRVTAYCPCRKCCGPSAHGVTASGHNVTENGGFMCAADPSIPFGTMLSIPGYNGGRPVPVWDRGGAVRGDRVDVLFPTHAQARRWGVRYLSVQLQRRKGK